MCTFKVCNLHFDTGCDMITIIKLINRSITHVFIFFFFLSFFPVSPFLPHSLYSFFPSFPPSFLWWQRLKSFKQISSIWYYILTIVTTLCINLQLSLQGLRTSFVCVPWFSVTVPDLWRNMGLPWREGYFLDRQTLCWAESGSAPLTSCYLYSFLRI